MKKLVIVCSYAPSLINFRGELLNELSSRGYKILALAPSDTIDKNVKRKLSEINVKLKGYFLDKSNLNFFQNYFSYLEIYKILKSYKPSKIIAYTAKPIIFSGLALRHFSNISFYPIITGLGYGFTKGREYKRKIIKILLIFLYTLSLKYSSKIFFQNKDDKNLFIKLKIINKKKKIFIINGSGVNLKIFNRTVLPKKPIFLMLSRLLIDKGVREYFDAAISVKKKYPKATFLIGGTIDNNPSGISIDEINSLKLNKVVKFLGKINNVKKILNSCKFYVLPSYREGTPRSTLEALAIGRPVITTDVPGCRETVVNNKNGYLIKPQSSYALAKSMIKLLNTRETKLKSMAKQSFLLAKKKFDIIKVNKKIIKILET